MKKLFVLALFAIGCQTADEFDFLTDGEADSSPLVPGYYDNTCPSDMALINGGSFTVGASKELMEVDFDWRVPEGTLTVEDFCVSAYPFPGKGQAWPVEGLNAVNAARLDAAMSRFGRRLITGSEYLVATSTAENHRYPSGAASWEAADCGPDDNPGNIGDYPCHSPYGVYGLLTFSIWGKVDEEMRIILQDADVIRQDGNIQYPDENTRYAVFGGLSPEHDACYGDDLHGCHAHPEYEEASDGDLYEVDSYDDDRGVLFAASPGTVTANQQAAYETAVAVFVDLGGAWSNFI